MSCSRFHFTFSSYGDVHGLVFETSICYWQDQPDSRFLSPGRSTGLSIRWYLPRSRSFDARPDSKRPDRCSPVDERLRVRRPVGIANRRPSPVSLAVTPGPCRSPFLEITKRTAADSGTVRGDKLDDHFPVESRRHQTFSSVVVFG